MDDDCLAHTHRLLVQGHAIIDISPLATTQVLPQRPSPTMSESAYLALKQKILNGSIPAGSLVSERVLAELIGTGKAPVRAALVRLAAEGLLTKASRQGIVISKPSIQDVIELFQMRVAMEVQIVREIAVKLRADQIDQLKQNLADYQRVAESVGPEGSIDADFRFHRLLSHFYGNMKMTSILDQALDSLYREVRAAQTVYPTRIEQSLIEHQAIADAIIAGSAEQAETGIRKHLRFAERFVLSRGDA